MTTAVRRRRLIPPGWQNPINRVLNLALYLILCFMIATGVVMWLRLPPMHGRHRGGDANTLLGLTRHEWGDWHLYAGLAFIAMCAVHLLMNWTWMMKIAASKHAWRVWAGIAVGAGIIAFFLIIPLGA